MLYRGPNPPQRQGKKDCLLTGRNLKQDQAEGGLSNSDEEVNASDFHSFSCNWEELTTSGTLRRILREVTPSKQKKKRGTPLKHLVAPSQAPSTGKKAQLARNRAVTGLSDGTGHAGVLHMAAVRFAPAGKLALVDGVFSPGASHVVHPDQTGTCEHRKKKTRERSSNWTLVFSRAALDSTLLHPEPGFMALNEVFMFSRSQTRVYSLQMGCFRLF